jgi:hypothetical protein
LPLCLASGFFSFCLTRMIGSNSNISYAQPAGLR